jgi:KDO2-lipid IV(A) lauroyltransferase
MKIVSAVLFYLLLPFIYLISLLPLPVLYLLSDLFYFIIYRLAGYRKNVVIPNLRNAFPEKTDAEIKAIARQFYHHLCDLFFETLKILTMSRKAMLKHCYFSADAQALYDKLAAEGKSIIMVMGHVGNWEWAGQSFSLQCRQQLYVLYHPLSNKNANNFVKSIRQRFGTRTIAMRSAYKEMLLHKGETNATVFLADQTAFPDMGYWTTFLNQDTPVFKGTETIAKKLGYPVVYAGIKKIKRGVYEMHSEMLCENPKATKEGEISELHTRRLEQDIITQPYNWLWSHRRWKYEKPQA